jgi:serine/threonine-protein kinase
MLESRLLTNRRQPTLSPPCELGPYKIERIIGEGGMGEVYAGRHTRLDRPVALKVIRGFRQGDPVSHSHFLKEAASAGKLDHPNLVRAYDAWEADGTLYLALELLDGKPLQKLAAEGRIASVREVLDAAIGICRGLEHLHASGLVHRDVKPANVMRLQDGSIKLIDFGLAVTGSPGTPHEGAVAPIAGTKGYMAPEQTDGSGKIDARTDIFGAGQVIRFLLRNVSSGGPMRGDGSRPDRGADVRAGSGEALPERA